MALSRLVVPMEASSVRLNLPAAISELVMEFYLIVVNPTFGRLPR